MSVLCFGVARADVGNNPAQADTVKINRALEFMRENYPEAQYADVYKNFMQDYFGPGHILADTAAAGRYLRRELRETERFDGKPYEPTGFNGNFFRVNLSLIKGGRIGYDDYFSAFTRSVSGIVPLSVETWKAIWEIIDGQILEKGYDYPDMRADRERIFRQLNGGDPVVHHSKRFNDNYSVYYRIISREIFEKELLPLIETGKP